MAKKMGAYDSGFLGAGGSPSSTMDALYDIFDELEAEEPNDFEPLDAAGLASALEEEGPGPEDTSLAEAVEAILAIDTIMNDLRTNALDLSDLRSVRRTLVRARDALLQFSPQHLLGAARAYTVAGRPVPALLEVLVAQYQKPLAACHPPPSPCAPGCDNLPIANLAAAMDLNRREAQLHEGWQTKPFAVQPSARPTVVLVPVDVSHYARI